MELGDPKKEIYIDPIRKDAPVPVTVPAEPEPEKVPA